MKTITNAQLRELNRKLSKEQKKRYKEELALYGRAVNLQRGEKNKVSSFHKPFTQCISKGKAHEKYEFGNKVGIITTGGKGRKIILSVKSFLGNLYDGHTIEPLLEQMQENKLKLPAEVVYDRGGQRQKRDKGS